MNEKTKILITGAGSFIGNHLVTSLKEKGHWIRCVEIKYPEFKPTDSDEFENLYLKVKIRILQLGSSKR